jgi:hypothetical protein
MSNDMCARADRMVFPEKAVLERNSDVVDESVGTPTENRAPATHQPLSSAGGGDSAPIQNFESNANGAAVSLNSRQGSQEPHTSQFRQGGRKGRYMSGTRGQCDVGTGQLPLPDSSDTLDPLQPGRGGRGRAGSLDWRRPRRDFGGRGRGPQGASFGGNRGEGCHPDRPWPFLPSNWQVPPHTPDVAVHPPLSWGPPDIRLHGSATGEAIIPSTGIPSHISGSPSGMMAEQSGRVGPAPLDMPHGYSYPGEPMRPVWMCDGGMGQNNELHQQWHHACPPHPHLQWPGMPMLPPPAGMQMQLPHPWMYGYLHPAPGMQYPPVGGRNAPFYGHGPQFLTPQMSHVASPNGLPSRRPPANRRQNSHGAHPAKAYAPPRRPHALWPAAQGSPAPHPAKAPARPSSCQADASQANTQCLSSHHASDVSTVANPKDTRTDKVTSGAVLGPHFGKRSSSPPGPHDAVHSAKDQSSADSCVASSRQHQTITASHAGPSTAEPVAAEIQSQTKNSASISKTCMTSTPQQQISLPSDTEDACDVSIASALQPHHVCTASNSIESLQIGKTQLSAAMASPTGRHPTRLVSLEACEPERPQQLPAPALDLLATPVAAASAVAPALEATTASTAANCSPDFAVVSAVAAGGPKDLSCPNSEVAVKGNAVPMHHAELGASTCGYSPSASALVSQEGEVATQIAASDVQKQVSSTVDSLHGRKHRTGADRGKDCGMGTRPPPTVGVSKDVDEQDASRGSELGPQAEGEQAPEQPAEAKRPAWGAAKSGEVAGGSLVERLRADAATGATQGRRLQAPLGSPGRGAAGRCAATVQAEQTVEKTSPARLVMLPEDARMPDVAARDTVPNNIDKKQSDSSVTAAAAPGAQPTAAVKVPSAIKNENAGAPAQDIMARLQNSEALQQLVQPPVHRSLTGSDDERQLECIGLRNPGYLCFMNACIQAMMGYPPFCKILQGLRGNSDLLVAAGAPTLSAFVAFTEGLGEAPVQSASEVRALRIPLASIGAWALGAQALWGASSFSC